MKKFLAKIASLLSLFLFVLFATIGFAVPQAPLSAAAETGKPTRLATTGNYAALSYGDTVYLYNGQNGGFWQKYVHAQPITKLYFDGRGNLYLLSQSPEAIFPNIYTLNAHSFQDGDNAQDTGISCLSFFVWQEELYYTNGSIIYRSPVDDLTAKTQAYALNANLYSLSYWAGEMYALDGYDHLYELSATAENAREIAKLPAGTREMLVTEDLVFCLTDAAFYGYDFAELSQKTNASLCTPIVEQAGSYTAMSASEKEIYLLGENTVSAYSIETQSLAAAQGAFARPKVNEIPVGSLKTTVLEDDASFDLVQTKENALLVEVEFHLDKEETLLPFIGATRPEAFTALKLAETEDYALLLRREQAAGAYQTYLVAKNGIRTLTDGKTTYAQPKTGTLSNAVGLYKFPDMAFPTLTRLQRGEGVTLVGEVRSLGCDYYAVEKDGVTGYIPKDYVTFYTPPTQEATQITLGDSHTHTNAVWFLACLVLGIAAVGILVDYLILRNKHED